MLTATVLTTNTEKRDIRKNEPAMIPMLNPLLMTCLRHDTGNGEWKKERSTCANVHRKRVRGPC